MDDMAVLLVAMLGGIAGSMLTALVSLSIPRSQRRRDAALALWDYHYALAAYAASEYESVIDEVPLIGADFAEVRRTLRAAYPFSGYLGAHVRRKLFETASIDPGPSRGIDLDDSLGAAGEISSMADLLRIELEWVFPLRMFGRLRAFPSRVRGMKS